MKHISRCYNVIHDPNLKLYKPNISRQINLGKLVSLSESTNGKDISEQEKSESKSETDSKKSDVGKKEYPEEPTTCCMSGCANCVWLEYAEKLSEYYKDGGEQAVKEINEKVQDPNIRAFLLHELRMRNIKK